MEVLRGLCAEEPGVILVDGVYGNGAVGRVAEAAEVAEATGSVLVVDETHSFGCAAGGLGVCEEAGVSHSVHFRTVGLSKACASRGGLVVGPSRALEAFRFVDRQMIFSTAPLEHEIVGCAAASPLCPAHPLAATLAANLIVPLHRPSHPPPSASPRHLTESRPP